MGFDILEGIAVTRRAKFLTAFIKLVFCFISVGVLSFATPTGREFVLIVLGVVATVLILAKAMPWIDHLERDEGLPSWVGFTLFILVIAVEIVVMVLVFTTK